jgi:hypothetical protein
MTTPAAPQPLPDATHLDTDAECLEDPVHCGDARHQHDRHQEPSDPPQPS